MLRFHMLTEGMPDKATGRVASRIHVYVYSASLAEALGAAAESEEMEPKWFGYNEVPYSRMWADDIHWLPQVSGPLPRGYEQCMSHERRARDRPCSVCAAQLLAGADVLGDFTMADASTLTQHEVRVLPENGYAASAEAAEAP